MVVAAIRGFGDKSFALTFEALATTILPPVAERKGIHATATERRRLVVECMLSHATNVAYASPSGASTALKNMARM